MSLQGNGVNSISNYLKNTLIPSVSDIRSANIFDNETTDLAGFPACTITIDSQDSKTIDTHRIQHVFKFTLRIFIDRNKQNFGSSTAESILRSTVGSLITAMDSDYTLGGNCIYCRPSTSNYVYADRENNNLRVIDLVLEAVDVNQWR